MKRLHIDGNMADGLRAVDEIAYPILLHAFAYGSDRLDNAGNVGSMRQDAQACIRPDGGRKVGRIDRAIRTWRNHGDSDQAAPSEPLQNAQNGVVFKDRGNNMVAYA